MTNRSHLAACRAALTRPGISPTLARDLPKPTDPAGDQLAVIAAGIKLVRGPQWKMLTALATTSAMAATDTADCSIIIIFAQRVSGITSLAANEMALVKDRWR